MAYTSPPTPETHAQLTQGWEHTGTQRQTPMDQTMPPSAPQNRPGCPRQPGPYPPTFPSFKAPWQLSAGGAGTGSCRTHGSRLGSPQMWELLSLQAGQGQRCTGLKGFTLPSLSWQPEDWQGIPGQALAGGHNTDTASLPLQTPASVLIRLPCHAPQDSPQADTSPNKGPARAWLCPPTRDSPVVPPQHQPSGDPGTGTVAHSHPWVPGMQGAAGPGSRLPPILREQDGQQHTHCVGGCRRAPGARTSRVSSPAQAVGSEASRPRRAELFC